MDGEDKHLCIVCNQTISGLLNYVLHRKNNCADLKTPEDNGNSPVNSYKIEVQELGNKRSSITLMKTNDHMLSNEKNEGHTMNNLQDDLPVDLQLGNSSLALTKDERPILDQEKNDEKLSQGITSLSGCEYDNNLCGVLDSIKESYSYFKDSGSEYFNANESLSFAQDIVTQSNKGSDINQFPEKICSEEESDNTDSVVIYTGEESELHSEKTSYATSDIDLPDDTSVGSEFGLLSFNVNSSSKKSLPLNVDNYHSKTSADVRVKDENKRNDKRKNVSTKRGCKRDDENFRKRKRLKKSDKTGSIHMETQNFNEDTINDTINNEVNSFIESDKVIGYDSFVRIDKTVHDDKEEYINIKTIREESDVGNGLVGENVFQGDFKSDPVCIDVKFEREHSNDVSEMKRDGQGMNLTLSCSVCNKQFANKHKLMTHLLTAYHKPQDNGKEGEHFSQVEMNQKAIMEESPFRCDLCLYYFNSNIYLAQHVKSKTHKENFASSDTYVMCSLCKFVAKSNMQLTNHLYSINHVEKVKQNNMVCAITVSNIQKKKIKVCGICPSEFNKTSSSRLHYQTAEHIRRKLALNSEKELLKLEEDDHSGEEIEIKLDKNEDMSIRKKDHGLEVDIHQNKFENRKVRDVHDETALVTKHSHINDTSLMKSDNEKLPSKQNQSKNQKRNRLSVCKLCAFETRKYNEMRIHYMKEHSQMVKICDVCDVVFPDGRGYKLHIYSKEHQLNLEKFGSGDLYQCDVCKKKFVEESYAKFHTAYFHYHLNSEEDLLKEYGKSITRTKYADFLEMIKGLEKNDQVSCVECGVSLRQANMLGHLRTHTGEKPFKCNLCSETFFNNFSLRRHLVHHFECFDKSCEVCGESFKCQTSYNCHMNIHKAEATGSGKSNVCHICGDSFYAKRKLQEHMTIHTEKTLKCDYPGCLWAFSTNHALKRHLLTHSDEYPFICATCGYATKMERYLKKHELIHTKEKEFHCEHCTYKAMTRTHLRRHMRIHLGVKPFKCPYCSYACNTHDNIRKHILETSFHKGLKVYPCRFCSYSTNSTSEYRTHIRLEHKEISDESLRGSLAVLSGLFNKEEETKAITECKEILPCREKKAKKKKAASAKNNIEVLDNEIETLNNGIVIEQEIIFEEVEIL